MRIWVLTSEYSPGAPVGGIAQYLDNFAQLAGRSGHEITIFAPAEATFERPAAPGVRWIGVAESDAAAALFGPARLSYRLADAVLRRLTTEPPPAVIESQDYLGIAYFLLQRKLIEPSPLQSVPVLLHLHTPLFMLAAAEERSPFVVPEYWIGQMERFCLGAADALLSPSLFLADEAARALPALPRATVIPYPHAASDAGAIDLVAGDDHELLYVGRLELRKGVLPFIEACARLWDAGETFRLSCAGGDGRYEARGCTVGDYVRQRYSAAIRQGRLRLLGRLDHAEVLGAMRRAAAVVIPSLWENFPNACIEPMALGKLVVVSQSGGQAEMVACDGENGIVFDWRQPGDCERAIRRAVRMPPEQRARIGRQARARIHALCDPTAILARREAHYRQVVEAHRPQPQFPVVWQMSATSAQRNAISRGEDMAVGIAQPAAVREVAQSAGKGQRGATTAGATGQGRGEHPDLGAITGDDSDSPFAAADESHAEVAPGVVFVAGDAAGAQQADPALLARAVNVLRRYPNVGFAYGVAATGDMPPDAPLVWNVELPWALMQEWSAPVVMVRCAALTEKALADLIQRRNAGGTALSETRAASDGAKSIDRLPISLLPSDWWLDLLACGWAGVALGGPSAGGGKAARAVNAIDPRAARVAALERVTHRMGRYPALFAAFGEELLQLQAANGSIAWWAPPLMADDRFASELAVRERLAGIEGSRTFRLAQRLARLARGGREAMGAVQRWWRRATRGGGG